MTQCEQVIAVLKKLGGRATTVEICKKMDFKQWKTKTPDRSVSMYLNRSNQIKREKNGNKFYYTLNESVVIPPRKNIDNKALPKNDNDDKNKDNGLYLICLSADVCLNAAGSLFKIGRTGDIEIRSNSYNNGLPFEPIRQIAFFPIPIEIDIQYIEKTLRNALLSSNDLGITKYPGGKQKEWLQTLSFDIKNEKERDILVSKVRKILGDILKNN